MLKAAAVMAKNKARIDVAPTRRGITRGETIYFFDPSGNRNETFAGLGDLAQRDTGDMVASFTDVHTRASRKLEPSSAAVAARLAADRARCRK